MSAEGLEYITFLVKRFGIHRNVVGVICHTILTMKEQEKKRSFLNKEASGDNITLYELLINKEKHEFEISDGIYDIGEYGIEEEIERVRYAVNHGMHPIMFVRRIEGIPESDVIVLIIK